MSDTCRPNDPMLTPILFRNHCFPIKTLFIDKFGISNFLFYPIRGIRATPEDMGRFMQQQGGQTLFGQEETLRKTRLILEGRPATGGEGQERSKQTFTSAITDNYQLNYT